MGKESPIQICRALKIYNRCILISTCMEWYLSLYMCFFLYVIKGGGAYDWDRLALAKL